MPTGLSVAIPENYEIQVRPRSGLAAKNGISVLNTPGTVDADYRGEIKVILINLSLENFKIEPGQRIAQMVLCPVVKAELVEVDTLPESVHFVINCSLYGFSIFHAANLNFWVHLN